MHFKGKGEICKRNRISWEMCCCKSQVLCCMLQDNSAGMVLGFISKFEESLASFLRETLVLQQYVAMACTCSVPRPVHDTFLEFVGGG